MESHTVSVQGVVGGQPRFGGVGLGLVLVPLGQGASEEPRATGSLFLAMVVSPAAPRGPVSADAPVCAEPTQLRLVPAFWFWSILALRQLPLCGLDALLATAGGAGRGWALGRVIIHVRDVVRDLYFGCHYWKRKKIPTGVMSAFPHQIGANTPPPALLPPNSQLFIQVRRSLMLEMSSRMSELVVAVGKARTSLVRQCQLSHSHPVQTACSPQTHHLIPELRCCR